MTGAPRKYNQTHEDLVLTALASGQTLTSICRKPGYPSRETILKWKREDPDFAERLEHARQLGFDAMADAVLDIADQQPEYAVGPQGKRIDAGHIAWQKLRTDMRLKVLERVCPERYAPGSKVSVGNKEGETLKVEGGVDTAALTLQLAAALRAAKDG